MKRNCVRAAIVVFLLCAGLVSSGFAVEPHFIVRESVNDVRVMTGGVGIDERNAMKELARDYNVRLEFATLAGSYVSNVRLVVETAAGDAVLDKAGVGPLVYLGLSPGAYHITAWFDNDVRTHTLEAGREPATVILSW